VEQLILVLQNVADYYLVTTTTTTTTTATTVTTDYHIELLKDKYPGCWAVPSVAQNQLHR
jgi:hypothetical protein